MRSDKVFSIISVVSTAFIIFLLMITVIASVTEKRFYGVEHNYTDFSSGWLNENNEEVKLEKISKSVKLHKTIPPMTSHMTLMMNAKNLNVEIFLEDECVYKYQASDNAFLKRLYGKTAGSDFIDVKITKESAGKTIYLNAECPYSNTRTCKIVNVYFGNSAEVVKHCTAVQLQSFCFGILLMFMGFICIIMYFPLKRHNVVNKSMFYLGMLSGIYGLIMITNSKLIQLIVGHETLFFTTSHMFMAIIPTPMLLFFAELYENLNKKIVTAICILNITDCFVIFILNLLGIADYNENIVIVLMTFSICLFYIGTATVQRMIKYKEKNIYHNIGVIIAGISVLLDIIAMRVAPQMESSSFMIIGLAAFSACECIQITTIVIDMNCKSVKTQIVSKLAYYDGLTELLNRTSFKEDMASLDEETPQDVLIAVFDVNNLKYVNDNFGHGCGDELIINVADSIRKSFSEMGKCYRIGGDEFVLISSCENAEQKYEKARDKMDKLISEADDRTDYPISVAVGYSLLNGRKIKLKEVFDEADTKMYKVKKEMKAKAVFSCLK